MEIYTTLSIKLERYPLRKWTPENLFLSMRDHRLPVFQVGKGLNTEVRAKPNGFRRSRIEIISTLMGSDLCCSLFL